MKPSVPFLLPGLVLCLAMLPASRGEFDHLRKDLAAVRQTLATMLSSGEKQGVERRAQVKQGANQVSARVTRNPTERPRG